MTILALRRSKVACQGWSRSERVELVRLSSEEREKYNLLLLQAKRMRSEATSNTISQIVLRTLTELRQICSHNSRNLISDARNEIQHRAETPYCRRCGDSIDSQAIQIDAVQQVQRISLCHDCSLNWTDNNSDLFLQHSFSDGWSDPIYALSTIKKSTSKSAGLSDQYDCGPIMNRAESQANVEEKSSKLDKVLSNLTDLQQAFHSDQTPVKR